jgi:hypothetical protein
VAEGAVGGRAASPVTPHLNEALAKAQAAFPVIGRERTVTVETKTGARYTFSYAPLDVILPKIQPVLAANGLSVTQLLDHGPALRTELRHASGETIGATFPFRMPESPQALGSLITYLRRYAIVALLGLATEADDDGNVAAGNVASSAAPNSKITKAQHGKIGALVKELANHSSPEEGTEHWASASRGWINEQFGKTSRADLTKDEAGKLIEHLEGQLEAIEVPFG